MTPDSETQVRVWKFPIERNFFGRDRAMSAHIQSNTSARPCCLPVTGFRLPACYGPDARQRCSNLISRPHVEVVSRINGETDEIQ